MVQKLLIDERNVSSYAVQFNARAKIGDQDWKKWSPATRTLYGSVSSESEDSLLSKDEWVKVKEFVNSQHKPPLPKELLANSFTLM